MEPTIHIDGSRGEGGGQILRSSLSLSVITGRALRIDNIRSGRKRPGLMRQHLTAVKAAATICGGSLMGAELGSTSIELRPGPVQSGNYHFSIGTAGSVGLVLQTILPPLLTAESRSTLVLEGGTHNPMSPPFDFLKRAFLPVLRRMGVAVELELQRYGFFPAGGGIMKVVVEPAATLERIDLLERGEIIARHSRVLSANLPPVIAEREVQHLRKELGWPRGAFSVETDLDSPGPGNIMLAEVECENVTEVFVGFGAKGVRIPRAAAPLVREFRKYDKSAAPVGVHLADQLLLPMAMAGGGSFRTVGLTPHTTTNIDVIRSFLPVKISTQSGEDRDVLVEVSSG